ncbi:hypothetical protein [Paraburkholderia sediminicola]|uniref:hypothetical protein n=1 Tax=Paraburkholderia sediminicola TaxID=458836 RepID=UPI0038BB25BA
MADTVEKVAAWLFQFARKKIDLSDRPANRSRTVVKGKKTPENLATETNSDFFNSIGRVLPNAIRMRDPEEPFSFRYNGHSTYHRSHDRI